MNLWTTKDGRKLLPRDMDTEHLRNCLAMLRRNGYCSLSEFYLCLGAAASLQGEYAQMAVESDLAKMFPLAIMDDFEEELERRGLDTASTSG